MEIRNGRNFCRIFCISNDVSSSSSVDNAIGDEQFVEAVTGIALGLGLRNDTNLHIIKYMSYTVQKIVYQK